MTRLPHSLLGRASRRHWQQRPWQSTLAVAGVALGVAVVVAIRLANASALAAFGLATEAIVGRATHQLVAGSAGVPERLYRDLRLSLPHLPAAPVVEAEVRLRPGGAFRSRVARLEAKPEAFTERGEDGPPETRARLRLIGVDPFAEGAFRPALAGLSSPSIDFSAFLTRPGAALLADERARQLGVSPGEEFELEIAGRSARLPLLGLLATEDERARLALADWVLVDLATAQELTGTLGRLSRIDLVLAGPAEEKAVLALLPPEVELQSTAARSRSIVGMSRAFRFNLSALSLLALLCGAFLIYNTVTFSVVERRPLFGTLRALGTSRREILRQVLTEAAMLGAVATALGLPLGLWLARLLVRQVTRTVNDFYFAVAVESVNVDAWSLVLGATLGVGAAVAAALPPAREATRTPPRAVMLRSGLEEGLRRALPRLSWAAVGGLGLGAGLLALPGRGLVPAFLGLLALVLGAACLAPLATVGLARLAGPPLARAFGAVGRLAAGSLAAALSRTGVAVASLAVAVSVTVGVGLMIASFRGSVLTWLATTLAADVYISASDRTGPPALDAPLLARMAALPGVARTHGLLAHPLETESGTLLLQALDLGRDESGSFELIAGDPALVWAAWRRGEGVLISEPLAYRRRLAIGDSLSLLTDQGPRPFGVLGVFSDFGPNPGAVVIERASFDRFWQVSGTTALALYLEPGVDADAVVAAAREVAGPLEERLEIRSTAELKRLSLAVFDRTFEITGVLRLLAALVAFLGVLSALMALELERAREFALLRALGLTPRGLAGMVMLESGLLGLAAGLLSVPVGTLMATVMITIINRRSFGWTLDLNLSLPVLLSAITLALTAALTAGLYPAWSMARARTASALRGE